MEQPSVASLQRISTVEDDHTKAYLTIPDPFLRVYNPPNTEGGILELNDIACKARTLYIILPDDVPCPDSQSHHNKRRHLYISPAHEPKPLPGISRWGRKPISEGTTSPTT